MITRKERPIVEASLECSEVISDALMRGDILAEVPFIGTAIKICKAIDAVRDRAFAMKLVRFVQNFEGITDKQKQKLREKISEDAEQAQKVGETLLFVLERLTDLDKPILLSKLFLAYIDSVLSSEELRRLSQSVDSAFGDDLQRLLTSHELPKKSDEPWMQYLVVSGLTRLVAGQTYGDIGKLYYEATPLAHKLRNAYFHEPESV